MDIEKIKNAFEEIGDDYALSIMQEENPKDKEIQRIRTLNNRCVGTGKEEYYIKERNILLRKYKIFS